MKGAILRLVVVVLFAAIGGFAARADEWYVNFHGPAAYRYCDITGVVMAFPYEYNLPPDGRYYTALFLNGVFLEEGEYPISGSYQDIYWNGFGFSYPFVELPYTVRQILVYGSDTGLMQTRTFAFDLYCDTSSQAHLTLQVYH